MADETTVAGVDEGSGSTTVADTDQSDTSTGEPAPDFALRFDGPNRATSSIPVLFDAPEYTVEAWIEILQENAQGAILSQQVDQHGYLLAIVPGSLNVVFTPWDEDMGFISVVAGTAPEVGVGWHHLAATQVDGELTMYLDGTAVDSQPVPPVSTVDAEITIGHNQNLPNWHLSGVVVDDVRITMHARYTEDFDPPVTFVDDGNVFLLVDLDEGAGATATDHAQGIVFDLEQPTWVPGYAG